MRPNKRSRKRAAKTRASVEARERFRYGLLAASTLKALSLEDLGLSLQDVEVAPGFLGEPEHMVGWLIFARDREAKRALGLALQLERRVKAALRADGFPSGAADSFELKKLAEGASTSLGDVNGLAFRFAQNRPTQSSIKCLDTSTTRQASISLASKQFAT